MYFEPPKEIKLNYKYQMNDKIAYQLHLQQLHKQEVWTELKSLIYAFCLKYLNIQVRIFSCY